jgi:hypothetical protein
MIAALVLMEMHSQMFISDGHYSGVAVTTRQFTTFVFAQKQFIYVFFLTTTVAKKIPFGF